MSCWQTLDTPNQAQVKLCAQPQTCIFLVDALHHQFQVFLIVLQVMDKLLKGQLVI